MDGAMQLICPPLPSAEGKQTNCWRLAATLTILGQLSLVTSVGGIFTAIINVTICVAYFWHLQYIVINVSADNIEVNGGPCRWCEEWTRSGSPLRFISPFFITSTQIPKTEIVSINKIVREGTIGKIWPNFFCLPVYWCCCYKSYSAWCFPFCCLGIDVAGQCAGDSDTSQMVEIVLNRTKWTLNLCTLCKYDKVAIAYRDEAIFDALRSNGYEVADMPTAAAIDATQPGVPSDETGQTETEQPTA